MPRRIVLYGAGALARECFEIVSRMARSGQDVECTGFLVDEHYGGPATLLGLTVHCGGLPIGNDQSLSYCIAIGDGTARARIAARLSLHGARFVTLIDPQVWIGATCKVGEGSILFGHSSVSVNSTLGRHVLVNPGCTVAHDNRIGDFCSLSPGVNLAGTVECEEGCFLGTGAVVRPRIRIGRYAKSLCAT
jgi:sugar O-acyltransferase (sialic acid O-acetyltransferase NeuD family)